MSYWPSLMLLGLAAPVMATTTVSGIKGQGQSRVSGGLVLQDASYETTNSFDVEGQILSFGYKTGVTPRLSLGLGLGYMIDGELGDRVKIGDGNGFRLMFDGQYEVKNFSGNILIATFGLTHDRFKFEERNAKVDFTVTDMKIGGLVLHRIDKLAFYGGLDLYLFSNGDIDYGNISDGVERDDRINIHLGAAFAIDPAFDIRADLYLIGEQTLSFAVDVAM